MDISEQFVNFHLSEQLKKLGVKQESLFCWITHLDLEYLPSEIRNEANVVASFSVAELGQMLPDMIRTYKYFQKHYLYLDAEPELIWECTNLDAGMGFRSDTEAGVKAIMLIHLIEHNLVTEQWRKQWLEE